ncbi:GtrA family protein [Candidatus Arsenophonus triatominarum]|uniref:GtrA family protein n=1 Tax=Candidatus Arsenophonus triatominarum TaxID=57911 RepID=UPI0009417DE7|nr:GtrA family protein [Candidatus Arsenophonus triatominarum]
MNFVTHFTKYFSIGIINTLIHWIIFAIIISITNITQAYANLIAFLASVTFSFFAKAKFTFNKKSTGCRYIAFIGFMGMMSYLIGCFSDKLNIYPILTLITFSTISLMLGFFFSKFVVFKGIE